MGKSAKWFFFFFLPVSRHVWVSWGCVDTAGLFLWLLPACLRLTDPVSFCQRSGSLSGRGRRRGGRLGEAQVEPSHTCLGTGCDPLAWRSPVRISRDTRHTAGTGASEAAREKKTSAPGSCLTPLTTLWLTFKNHSRDARASAALAACGWRASRGKRSKRFLANALENMGKQSW